MDQKKREFIELFKRTGWTQAEAARQLHWTRGGINGVVTGGEVPSATVLKLLHYIVCTEFAEPGQTKAETAALHEKPAEHNAPRNDVEELLSAIADASVMNLRVKALADKIKPKKQWTAKDVAEKAGASFDHERSARSGEKKAVIHPDIFDALDENQSGKKGHSP